MAASSGTTVTINGQNIPLFYVSPTQINGQLPFEIPAGSASVTVTANNLAGTAATVSIAPAAPGIFLIGATRAAVTNSDNTVNASSNPAAPGDSITIYFTGIGPLDHPVPTGQPAPVTGPLSRATLPVIVTIGGQTATISYIGLTPGSISLAQANVTVPQLASGDYPVVIQVGTATSNAPVITVATR